MVEINSFKQAYQRYLGKNLPLPILQDIAFMLMSACQDIPPNVSTYTDINPDNLIWLSGQLSAEFSFDEYLGGHAYICELEADLLAIKGYDSDWFNQHGEWPNVTDKAMRWDVCQLLNDDWAVFAYCWNNAGGNVFYVPQSLWRQAKVSEHLQINLG